MAEGYAGKHMDDFGIKGYKVPGQPEKHGLRMKDVLKYYPEDEAKKKSFMNTVINHSK